MRPKPRVLVIASLGDPPYVGGIENVVDTLLRSKLNEQVDFAVFDTYRVPDPKRTRIQKGIYAVQLIIDCWSRLHETKPDLVHIHFCSRVDFWKHAICLQVSRSYGAKTIFHLHGGAFGDFLEEMNPLQKSTAKWVFGSANRVIALSPYWKQFLLRLMSPEAICVLSNPIDCDRLSSGEREFDREHPRVLLLGRLGKGKGHYDALKALPLVLEKHPKVRFLFAGGDDDQGATEDLKRLAKDRGLAAHIEFLGAVPFGPKVKLLRTSTMMILPSYAENMPLSVLEAMAAGLPVIATRVGAVPEILDEGRTGILIEAGDWRGLAASIVRILDQPSYADELSRLAQDKARGVWDVEHIADQVDALYREVLRL